MIFVSGSSLWWSSSATAGKVLGAYGAVSVFSPLLVPLTEFFHVLIRRSSQFKPSLFFSAWFARKCYLWIKYRRHIDGFWVFLLPVKLDLYRFTEALERLGAANHRDFVQPDVAEMQERSKPLIFGRFGKLERRTRAGVTT